MRTRFTVVGAPASLATALLLAGCGALSSPNDPTSTIMTSAAAPTVATSTVAASTVTSATVTSTVHATGTLPADPAPQSTPQTTQTLPAGHGTGISAFAGHWQRHDSSLDIDNTTLTGTLLMGASAIDVEKWNFTWERSDTDSDTTSSAP